MRQINSDEKYALEFEFSMEGAGRNVDATSIIIETGNGFDIKVPATFDKEEGSIRCELPALQNIVESGVKNLKMEIVVDGKVYTPLTEEVEILAPLKIEAKSTTIEEAAPKFEIKARAPAAKTLTYEVRKLFGDEVLRSTKELLIAENAVKSYDKQGISCHIVEVMK